MLQGASFEFFKTDETEALRKNMVKPAGRPIWQQKFWNDYEKRGYEYCLKKYTIYGGVLFKIKRKILKMMQRW
ncbi:hypothetical protein [Acetobacterium wieringae]|uniref:hypothetical protein n=1 Tax=Acetobacterium wieringae TaxID=52694 RepID=UPI0026EAF4E4|nr:hypothetical protein [Acetobacterium wieringae]